MLVEQAYIRSFIKAIWDTGLQYKDPICLPAAQFTNVITAPQGASDPFEALYYKRTTFTPMLLCAVC